MCDFCEKIKKALNREEVVLEPPFYLGCYGIIMDDGEYRYFLEINWKYCPECGTKIR